MQDQDEIMEAMTEEPIGTAEEAAQKARMLEHFSFGHGLFPIHIVRTPAGAMGKCEINSRKFSFATIDASGPDDHACTIRIFDGDEEIFHVSSRRGRAISDAAALGLFKAYVKDLSGGGSKFHHRGGFLKQQIERAKKGGAK